MARPEKIGLDYFPFDVDFFQDIKIRKLIRYQGSNAIAIYAFILCNIYKDGYYIRWDDDLPFIISEQTGYEESYIVGVINCCLDIGLFSKKLFDSERVITSFGIQDRYRKINDLCRRKSDISEYMLISSEEKRISSEEKRISSEYMLISSEETPITSAKSTQIKEKEIKEKERRDNTPRARDDVFFENGTKALKYFIENWDRQVADEYKFTGFGPSPVLSEKFNRYELLKNKNNLDKLIMSRITIPELADKPWGYFFGQNNFFDMVITNGYKGYGKTTNKQQSDYQKRATGEITEQSITTSRRRLAEIENEFKNHD